MPHDYHSLAVGGDAAGIGGATVAQCSGEIAGLQIAHRLGLVGLLERDRMAGPIQRRRHLAARPFLDAWFAPAGTERVDRRPRSGVFARARPPLKPVTLGRIADR